MIFLLLILGVFVPRLALVFVWLFTPYVARAFDSFFLPLLGLFFLPFTTLIYALVFTPGIGVEGVGWLAVLLAFFIDIATYSSSRYRRGQTR